MRPVLVSAEPPNPSALKAGPVSSASPSKSLLMMVDADALVTVKRESMSAGIVTFFSSFQ